MSKQKLQQKQDQNLTFQQIQFLSLLQIPLVNLEKRIEEELEENPVLEEENEGGKEDRLGGEEISPISTSSTGINNSNSYDLNKVQIEDNNNTLYTYLHEQLIVLNLKEKQKFLISYLINSLDESGFLNRDLYSICSDLLINHELSVEEVELYESLKILQSFEPYGVGARSLQECIAIQLKKHHHKNKKALLIIKDYYSAFTNKNFNYLTDHLNISKDELKKIYLVIESLNPRPGSIFSKSVDSEYIDPDFKILITDGLPELRLNKTNKKPIKINRYYSDLLEETKDSETKKFLKQKIEKARWFKDALNKRKKTLKKVMEAIMQLQEKYFVSGDEKDLIPMKLADVAQIVNMDLSTISRVSNSKYIETSFGVFKVKELFSEAYRKDNGEVISTREIKTTLKEIIDNENKQSPFTDEEIANMLAEQQYSIARRTVAKYRESISVPTAKLRRRL